MNENELPPMRRRRFVRVEAIAQIFATAPAVDGARLRDDRDEVADQDITPNAWPHSVPKGSARRVGGGLIAV